MASLRAGPGGYCTGSHSSDRPILRMARARADTSPALMSLTERERECLNARLEKLDLELLLGDRWELSDQLIQSLLGHGPAALSVHVEPVGPAGGLSIEAHAESDRLPAHRRPHDQMQVPRVKASDDPPVGLSEHRGLSRQRPVTRQRPAIQRQVPRCGIRPRAVRYAATR